MPADSSGGGSGLCGRTGCGGEDTHGEDTQGHRGKAASKEAEAVAASGEGGRTSGFTLTGEGGRPCCCMAATAWPQSNSARSRSRSPGLKGSGDTCSCTSLAVVTTTALPGSCSGTQGVGAPERLPVLLWRSTDAERERWT